MARLSDSVSEYKEAVREKVLESHQQLYQILHSDPIPRVRRHRSLSPQQPSQRTPRSTVWDYAQPVEHSDFTYGAAASRLKGLLYRYEDEGRYTGRKNVQFTPRPYATIDSSRMYAPMPPPPQVYRGDIPGPEETLLLLQNQGTLNQQLEIENKYMKDEVQNLKLKLAEVVEENRILHEEIKRNAIQEIISQGISIPGIGQQDNMFERKDLVWNSQVTTTQTMNIQDLGKWQKELERIQSLHVAKAARLEAQLDHVKKEKDELEDLVVDLRAKVKVLEVVSSSGDGMEHLNGLCVRCAQNDALLPSTVAHSQRRSIDQLTRERDDLMNELTSLRSKYASLQSREEEAYLQVKKAVEMVEIAQIQKAQAEMQRQQAKEDLDSMRNRLSDHAEQITRRLTDEREVIRTEFKDERNELNTKIKELTEAFTKVQNELERVSRDKIALMAELEIARGHLDSSDINYGRATDSMKMSVTTLTIERNKALEEYTRMKVDWDQFEKDRDKEKLRYRMEIENLKRRLEKAEHDLLESKEQCILLTTNMQQLEKETHMAKLTKDKVEQMRTDSIKNLTKQAEQREMELNTLIDQMDVRNSQTVKELENLVASHEDLQRKLREECKQLATQLEDNNAKYRRDNKDLKTKVELLSGRLKRAHDHIRELENQHNLGGLLQEKMRDRLKQMDHHAIHTSQQVLDLLSREAELMRDRQTLAREVEFLRRNLNSEDMCRIERNVASEVAVINDILNNVRSEREKQIKDEVNEEVMEIQQYAHIQTNVKDLDADRVSSISSQYSEDFENSD